MKICKRCNVTYIDDNWKKCVACGGKTVTVKPKVQPKSDTLADKVEAAIDSLGLK